MTWAIEKLVRFFCSLRASLKQLGWILILADNLDREKNCVRSARFHICIPLLVLFHPPVSCHPRLRLRIPSLFTSRRLSAWPDRSSDRQSPLYQTLFSFCDCDQCLGHVSWKKNTVRNFTQIFTNKHFHIAGPVRTDYLLHRPVAIQLCEFQGAFHAQACPTRFRLPAHFPR